MARTIAQVVDEKFDSTTRTASPTTASSGKCTHSLGQQAVMLRLSKKYNTSTSTLKA